MTYNHQKIEKKWQKAWAKKRIYQAKDKVKGKKNFMLLTEFPYPSGNLHIGHWYAFAVPDILSRYLGMNGKNVMYPIGFDAFGLPAENAAIKRKINPRVWTEKNIKYMTKQLESMGAAFDWSRKVSTINPEYYRWTQWIFLKMYEKDLAYRTKILANWCPSCKTVLANEQVVDGKCERCGSQVAQKDLEQWMFKITEYADRLIDDIEGLDWPETTKLAQKNWIGRSEGAEVEFRITNYEFRIKVFTTRVDTLFGVTYLVLAPEHSLIKNLKSEIKNWPEVEKYIEQAQRKTDLDRQTEQKEKTGVELKGIKVINPANGKEVPVWITDYVLAHYGTGAVMAVPAHDQRDFEFAKKFGLPIRHTVQSTDGAHTDKDNISKVVILHGRQQFEKKDKPPMNVRHWLGWLKDELEKANIKTINPLIEKDWEATYADWKNEFDKIQIDENTILVGTSAGGAFLVRWLGETKQIVKKIILVAPSYRSSDNKDENKKEFYNFTIDKGIRERAKNIIIYISNDTKEHIDDANLYTRELGAKLIKIDGRGHFTETSSPINKQFPELLNAILDNENVFIDDGILINSDQFDGMDSEKARSEIVGWLAGKGQAQKKKSYRLRDWVLSRQRYWGVPIPMIKCENCGFVPVAEKNLPVKLPPLKDFLPADDGRSPLAKAKKWASVKCPKCKGAAERETDTMDTFVDSSWYFIRYADPKNKKKFAGVDKMKNWLPVPMYIGGAEHNTMHLLYSRFFTKVLYDLKLIYFKEPFIGRRNHGTILGPDGQKMSKSKGNVIDPDEEVKKYGADCVRMYLAFMGPYDQGGPWNPNGILGIKRFLERTHKLKPKVQSKNKDLDKLLHKTIKKVTEDMEGFRFNTAISALMVLLNEMEKQKELSIISCQLFVKLLAPFAPHLAEELWHQLGNKKSVHFEKWPKYDERLIREEEFDLIIQVNGKTRAVAKAAKGIVEANALDLALSQESVKRFVANRNDIRKIIFVPDRLINIIV